MVNVRYETNFIEKNSVNAEIKCITDKYLHNTVQYK